MKINYPIKTERLYLRPLTAADLDDIHIYHSDPNVVRYMFWEPRSYEETRAKLEDTIVNASELAGEGTRLVLAVVLPESGKVIGEMTLFWRSEFHQQGEIGFVFNPAYGGKGYATEAARTVLDLGFEQLALHRIYGRCDARNSASYKLMERLGMRREAHLVQNEIFKGEWGDELIYAILREEWFARG